mmetsp:Transcript_107592/g.302950  ORF Transcript_107592/g.302950 Transcript_107592/m.302950 type:complete len:204 (-) Transcript_107592:202-813(-)
MTTEEPAAAEPDGADRVKRVENMISKAFRSHPDADVLIPLALLEVATDDEQRASLEDAVEEPRRFRDYVFRMVSAVLPTEAPDEVAIDREHARPVTPAQRDRLCKRMGSRLDVSIRLNAEEAALGSTTRSLTSTGGTLGLDLSAQLEDGAECRPSIVPPRVPRSEVRKAYLQLAKHYHPDKGGDQEMFRTLNEAYELLQVDAA